MAEMLMVYRIGGEIAEPPALTGDEDLDVERFERFVLAANVSTRCSEDGTAIYPSTLRPQLEQFCERGHCWRRSSDGFDNVSRSEINPGWRQAW